MRNVKAIENLIKQLTKLPGIGPKTAQRLAYKILFMPEQSVRQMADALIEVKETIVECPVCFNLTDVTPCQVCTDETRSDKILCVVEEPKDVFSIERSGKFGGRYHVLHGSISPMENIGPEDLRIEELINRVEKGNFAEVILATNPSVEGEATSMYIARLLKGKVERVSRLAHGLPIGGELEYADELTLGYALEGRKDF
ncbi:recombination protein RecR [Clostridia bacterium]|nr:recombination protein RecR [Clostridia bacterium]